MRIALLVGFYAPAFRGGGPIRSAVAMVAEHGSRHDFLVLTSNADWGVSTPLPVPTERWTDVGAARVWYANPSSILSLMRGLAEVRREEPDVLYLNSVLNWRFSILPVVLARVGYFGKVRVLVAPRGELDPGALALKAGKKRLFLALARRLGLYRKVSWHASSESEASDIRAVYPRARVVVRENEVSLPKLAAPPTQPAFGDGGLEPALRVVFLSRLVPNKGLHRLLAALAHVSSPVTVRIFGEGPQHYLDHCLELASRLPPNVRAVFAGPVRPENVSASFAEADLFVFPTAHENFGHVIAEALAASCPVLLADVTPWTRVLRYGGGAVVESLDPAVWGSAIEAWASTSPSHWLARRWAAGQAFSDWQSQRELKSIFDLALMDGTIRPPKLHQT